MDRNSEGVVFEKISAEEFAALEGGLRSEATCAECTVEESMEFARTRRIKWMNTTQKL
jgi:hypothetical protein